MAKAKRKPAAEGKKTSRKREPYPVALTPRQIQNARTKHGLTQEQAAKKVGVARRTWMYYESGKQFPPPPIVILIKLLDEGTI